MNKICLLYIVFLMHSFYSTIQSQNVTVDLEITWEKENVYHELNTKQKAIDVPYLNITYTNLSDSNLYLRPLISLNKEYLPIISNSSICNPFGQFTNLPTKIEPYPFDTSIVAIDQERIIGDTCFVLNSKGNKEYCYYENEDGERELLFSEKFISEDLEVLFQTFTIQNFLTKYTDKKLKSFTYPDKKIIDWKRAKNIYETSLSKEHNYLFLKKRQSKNHKISLVHFLLLKGHFIFQIENNAALIPTTNKSHTIFKMNVPYYPTTDTLKTYTNKVSISCGIYQ